MNIKKYICDKPFLQMVLAISIPVVLQQVIESLVSLADSVMVSSYSEVGVSAVQIGSQWEEIAFLLSFGICSGVGIYCAQFFGSGDYKEIIWDNDLNVYLFINSIYIISFCITRVNL